MSIFAIFIVPPQTQQSLNIGEYVTILVFIKNNKTQNDSMQLFEGFNTSNVLQPHYQAHRSYVTNPKIVSLVKT